MRRHWMLSFALLTTLLLGGQTPTTIQSDKLQEQLSDLTRRGFTYRMLDNDLIELTDPLSGEKHLKSLREPSEATIRSWAAQRGIPILEIDPRTIDTSQYTGWFRYWSRVPVSSDPGLGQPLIVGDVNRNGKTDVYGLYWDFGTPQRTYAYEVDTNGAVNFMHDYSPVIRLPIGLTDADSDSLIELALLTGDSSLYFEQSSYILPPASFQFGHRHIENNLYPLSTNIVFARLDSDSLIELIYKGSERDSIDTTFARIKVYVAEYKPQANNFVRVWATDFALNNVSGIGGFAVNDFDGDGKMEFAACELAQGRIYVTENVENDSFAVTWMDSVPFSNLYYGGSGDVDHEGLPEFFAGATISSGDWFTMFEADSNNHYSARFLIHLLSGGTFDNPQILSTDVDGDGRLELVICAGADIYICKSSQDNSYYLWYLKRENARDGIQFYNFDRDVRQDMIIGKTVWVDPPGYPRSYADIYVATSLVSVSDAISEVPDKAMLFPNYPNPFNPSTVIQFSLPSRSHVFMVIYDMLGKEVEKLLEETMGAGMHTVVWRGEGRSAGIYICRLIADNQAVSRKLLLIH